MTPTLPDVSTASLADLLPSIAAHLGVPDAADDLLGLPGARRFVVLLVDGLGAQLLNRAVRQTPYFAGLLGASPLTAGVPSTTVTSLTTLGTGVPPGQHGMAGYTFRIGPGRLLGPLGWDQPVDPMAVQPKTTWFERCAAAGVTVGGVVPERFLGSGLTRAALRGPDFAGVGDERDEQLRIDLTVAAATAGPRTLVYTYERELDHTGHSLGCESRAWASQLRRIDAFAERLRDALPDDVVLIVTGDHGMVDVPSWRRLVAEHEPDLLADVQLLGGEGRLRQLYVGRGREESVAHRWRDRLGADAWVLTRREAIEAGWFGPMDVRVADRFGDVMVACRRDFAVLTTARPKELALVGMHGSLTAAEMLVPLLVD